MFDTYLKGFAYPLKSPPESTYATRTLIEDREFSTEKVSTSLPRIEAGVGVGRLAVAPWVELTQLIVPRRRTEMFP
jgi:hypothetical protein